MLLSTLFISPEPCPITINQPHLVPITEYCRKPEGASGKGLPPTSSLWLGERSPVVWFGAQRSSNLRHISYPALSPVSSSFYRVTVAWRQFHTVLVLSGGLAGPIPSVLSKVKDKDLNPKPCLQLVAAPCEPERMWLGIRTYSETQPEGCGYLVLPGGLEGPIPSVLSKVKDKDLNPKPPRWA